jgi:hypothetical protein
MAALSIIVRAKYKIRCTGLSLDDKDCSGVFMEKTIVFQESRLCADGNRSRL